MIYVEHIARDVHFSSKRQIFLRENTSKCVFYGVFAGEARARASSLVFCSFFLSLSLSLEMLRVFSLSLRGWRDESSLSLSAGCY